MTGLSQSHLPGKKLDWLDLSHEQEHAPAKKTINNLKESMIKADPFPKLSVKAAEAKSLLLPVACCLQDFEDQDPSKKELLQSIVKVLQQSHDIDVLVDSMNTFKIDESQGKALEKLVYDLNVGTTKLCHFFTQQGLFLFNFLPKNHYLFHLAQRGRHMSPKLSWCYQGEDLMQKIKKLAQSCFSGTLPRNLGSKIISKYLVGLDLTLGEL